MGEAMNSAAIARRVAALHLQNKEAGLKDWLKWFVQPFKVIWKHHRKFVQGPVDDAVDAIIKDLAPRLVRAIGEKEVEEDLREFTDGAIAGKWDADQDNMEVVPKNQSADYKAGYSWGYEHADEFRDDLPASVRRKVIENALKVYRKTITEEVVEQILKQVWSGINPKHTMKAMQESVKKHGWKLGVGFALFEVFEHFVLPAFLAQVTGDPKMLALGSVPIGEVIYAVMLRMLGRTPKEVDKPTEEGHLDWYENNFGKIRLASLQPEFPSFDEWQNRWFVYKHACLLNDPMNLPSVGNAVERMVQNDNELDIYFDDGSWVSAKLEKPSGGCGCGGSCGCGGACSTKTAAEDMVDLVAVVRDGEFLGAKDANRMGAKDAAVWQFSGIDRPFDLYLLKNVPLMVAEPLVDFGTPAGRLRDGKKAWRMARKYAGSRPFKRV
jgi:hypothetical protein